MTCTFRFWWLTGVMHEKICKCIVNTLKTRVYDILVLLMIHDMETIINFAFIEFKCWRGVWISQQPYFRPDSQHSKEFNSTGITKKKQCFPKRSPYKQRNIICRDCKRYDIMWAWILINDTWATNRMKTTDITSTFE